jgi:hypothetical protein
MPKQYLLRTSLAAALALACVAGPISSFAATTAGNQSSRGPSNPGGGMGSSGGGGNGGSGAGMPDARLVKGNCPPGVAVAACTPRKPPTLRIQTRALDHQRCSNSWRLVELEDGSIVEDRSEPMRKNCRVIRVFD